jgi:hypothetical protein
MPKVFAMNDCDWMAGEDVESCIVAYLEFTGCGDTPGARAEYIDEPHEVSDAVMDGFSFVDDDRTKRTFREQLQKLIDDGTKFPVFFASTEF